MPNYELVARDGGGKLHVTILDSVTKEAIDLTGKTVQARYSLNGAATVEKAMTVLSQLSNVGEAEYQFLATDLLVGGSLKGEVRLQAGLSDQLTTVDTFHISVKDPLP
jgi:hypothetical protein